MCSGGGLLALISMYKSNESRAGGDIGDCAGVPGYRDIPLSCNPFLPIANKINLLVQVVEAWYF